MLRNKFSIASKLIICSSLSTYLLGCADLNNVRATRQITPALQVFSYSDDLQNTFVTVGKNGTRFCSQADADAAQSYSDGIAADIGPVKSGAGELKDSVTGSSLGGRNPEVLIVREMMYRACELSSNYDVTYDEARSIYTEFLNAAVALGKDQTGTGVAATSATISTSQSISRGAAADSDSDSDDSDSDSDDSSKSSSSK